MGEVGYARFVRSDVVPGDPEMARVDELAAELKGHLTASSDAVDAAHVYGAQSSAIQKIVSTLLKDTLGFGEEVVLTPQDGLVIHPRPDFFYRLAPDRGVLAEVERGGTTLNNHDLKDIWKTHVSPDAQHLLLIVPHVSWARSGKVRERPFQRVTARLREALRRSRRA